VAVDCPYTFSDTGGVERETRYARRLGYVAKSLVDPAHAAIVNGVMTPGEDDLRRAREIVSAFEAARERGGGRAELDGALVEVPSYSNAKRLIARAEALHEWQRVDG
jgi:citrate lyase subunit beta/citryl-CoA lyase